MEKTAVEYLLQQMGLEQLIFPKEIIDKAKQMEKQQMDERMYSEADNIMKFLDAEIELKLSDEKTIKRIKWYFETYFEQFKKK